MTIFFIKLYLYLETHLYVLCIAILLIVLLLNNIC